MIAIKKNRLFLDRKKLIDGIKNDFKNKDIDSRTAHILLSCKPSLNKLRELYKKRIIKDISLDIFEKNYRILESILFKLNVSYCTIASKIATVLYLITDLSQEECCKIASFDRDHIVATRTLGNLLLKIRPFIRNFSDLNIKKLYKTVLFSFLISQIDGFDLLKKIYEKYREEYNFNLNMLMENYRRINLILNDSKDFCNPSVKIASLLWITMGKSFKRGLNIMSQYDCCRIASFGEVYPFVETRFYSLNRVLKRHYNKDKESFYIPFSD